MVNATGKLGNSNLSILTTMQKVRGLNVSGVNISHFRSLNYLTEMEVLIILRRLYQYKESDSDKITGLAKYYSVS